MGKIQQNLIFVVQKSLLKFVLFQQKPDNSSWSLLLTTVHIWFNICSNTELDGENKLADIYEEYLVSNVL